MKTAVYQSYRTSDVPAWIERCLSTVQRWAAAQGFDYRFIDDRLFDYAPQWYRRKVADNILLVSDLARLVVAKELLHEGYQRAIWLDADVVVFAPQRFSIGVTDGYALCREVWVEQTPQGQLTGSHRVNNAAAVFVEPNDFLDFYIHASKQIVHCAKQLDKLAVGTRFLTALWQLVPFRLIDQVGLFSPVMMRALAGGQVAATLGLYRQATGSSIYAANLCASFRNSRRNGVEMTDDLYDLVVDNLTNAPPEALGE
jgi:hypothetical protein